MLNTKIEKVKKPKYDRLFFSQIICENQRMYPRNSAINKQGIYF
jgi:hypothetical protein